MRYFIGTTGTRKNVIKKVRRCVEKRDEKKFKFIKGAFKIGKTETIIKALKISSDYIARKGGKIIAIFPEIFGDKETDLKEITKKIVQKFGEIVINTPKRSYNNYFELGEKLRRFIRDIDEKGDIANIRNNLAEVLGAISNAEPELITILIVPPNENSQWSLISELLTIVRDINLFVIFEIYDETGLDGLYKKIDFDFDTMGSVKTSQNFDPTEDIEILCSFNFDECKNLLRKYKINENFDNIVDKIGSHPNSLDTFCKKIINRGKSSIDICQAADDLIEFDRDFDNFTKSYFKILNNFKSEVIKEYEKFVNEKSKKYIPKNIYCKCMEEVGLIYRLDENDTIKSPVLFESHIRKYKTYKYKEEPSMENLKEWVEKLLEVGMDAAGTSVWNYLFKKSKNLFEKIWKTGVEIEVQKKGKAEEISLAEILALIKNPNFLRTEDIRFIYFQLFNIDVTKEVGNKREEMIYDLIDKTRSESGKLTELIKEIEKYGNKDLLK